MIDIKSEADLERMRAAARVVVSVQLELEKWVQPGVTTLELDRLAEKVIREAGARPAFKGYRGYPATLCTSINEQVVHGIPGPVVLKEGDIVSLDVGCELAGFYGDMARTLPVGRISRRAERLLRDTRASLYAAIDRVKEGGRVSDVSRAVQDYAEARGYGVVKDFVGHGIGRNLHEEPQVPNFVGAGGRDVRLKAGMVLAIEPMLNLGSDAVEVLPDRWTVVTRDKSLSAHFEHTCVVTHDGPEILTWMPTPEGI
ncbi:type I methionyl aminopeptidase [bacterium]|nr:type I methionyl aminopeptidase [bacterium]